ncbi:MAG: site-specific integrase [Selenomonas sp.]|uniref:tyrosine-type recombinase/integrase n=1 Tax=Selenomonas sp. TaxID=2053611 RepID=UPI0025F848E0|nr:site-specific integrase [Selenomonas sp.]MCR5440085.1 site-specific integrase [Selenomonas sp.]
MRTKHKYITYRQDKETYIVSMTINSKKTYVTCHSLEEAIQKRDSLVELHKLDKNIIGGLSSHRVDKVVPILEEAFTEYVEKEIRPRVALSTYSKYNLTKNNYCKHLGNIKIDRITHESWQSLFSSRQEKYHLARSYIIDDVRRFKAMYNYYINLGIVKDNPLDKPIKLHNTPKIKRRAFTEEEKEIFLLTAKEYDHKFFTIFSLYFSTGARRSELLALQWQDIDTFNKCIRIRRSIGRGTVNGKFTELIGNTKTVGSVRDIPISGDMLNMLLSLRKEAYKQTDFVFTNTHHIKYDHMSLNSIQRAFRIIADKAGLDKCLSIHCIRHYVASKLITNGVDLSTVQSIGGWKSPSVLLSVYAHSNEDAKRKALEKTLF